AFLFLIRKSQEARGRSVNLSFQVSDYNVLSLFVKKGSKVIKNSVENKRERDDTIAKSDFYVDLLAYSLDFLPIGIGIIMVIQGHIALASFVAVQYSSAWIVNSFFSINSIRNQIAATKPMTAKLLSFKPLTTKQDEAPVKFKQLNMYNVTFGYQADSPVLNNVSLCVNKGDKILLTGKSGEGKSTLLKVLMGKLSPQKGRVLVNDQAVETQIFSEVQQSSQIFNVTLRFNLTLGKQFDQKQIVAAAQQAGLTNYLQKHGLDTVIEENGHNLSGGERKRIELARAFLFQREILVVDEGTASLDPQTAEQIHNVFLNSPLTVIEIDHHISSTTMKKFTHHFDLENGKLVNIF
ncbi:ABC transporter ATP-binding protein/permease, partial [Lactobacillus crispatus]